jgi:tetratricopeptide (TPR) repeat protein
VCVVECTAELLAPITTLNAIIQCPEGLSAFAKAGVARSTTVLVTHLLKDLQFDELQENGLFILAELLCHDAPRRLEYVVNDDDDDDDHDHVNHHDADRGGCFHAYDLVLVFDDHLSHRYRASILAAGGAQLISNAQRQNWPWFAGLEEMFELFLMSATLVQSQSAAQHAASALASQPRARGKVNTVPSRSAVRSASASTASATAMPPSSIRHEPFATASDALHNLCTRANSVFNGPDADFRGALPLFEQLLILAKKEMASTVTTQTVLDVVFTLMTLGAVKRQLDDFSGALQVLEQAVALAESTVASSGHTLLAESLAELGRVYRSLGRFAEADTTFQRSLTMREQMLGPNHLEVAMSLIYLANSCREQGNFLPAKGLLKRALAIAELHAADGKFVEELHHALEGLSSVYLNLDDFSRALPLAERLLASVSRHCAPHGLEMFSALVMVGACLQAQGRLSEAEPILERNVATMEKYYGPNHSNTARALSNLSDCILAQGDHRRATAMVQRALTIQEREYGPQHVNVANLLVDLADCYEAAGDLPQAQVTFQRSLSIYDSALGRTHPNAVTILRKLAELAIRMDQPQQAVAWTQRAAVAAVTVTHQTCGWCKRTDVRASKYCGKCKSVWYCNEECQRKAWKEHKKHCFAKPTAPAEDAALAAK